MKRAFAAAFAGFSFIAVAAFSSADAAPVAQWNQVVVDRELRSAFYRALREVAVDYIGKIDEAGLVGAITFVDHQLDYPLQLTSSDFNHIVIDAAQGKVAYLLRYQAKTTAGTTIPIGTQPQPLGSVTAGSVTVGATGYGASAEIPGDGGMMLCPINKDGLEFMFGGLAIASLGEDHQFRVKQDGADIIALHDRILELTYEYYGHTPDEGNQQ